MIQISGLTKDYSGKLALYNVSFDVLPGRVTAFLGPNGSGKSTTLRILLGLETASEGTALIDGVPYSKLKNPIMRVGAMLDSRNAHAGRTAFSHLRSIAITHGISKARVHEVLALVGLEGVAKKRVGGFSLGMQQRLGIAGALLGDPELLIFDEPLNGLDINGIRWFRAFVADLVAQGKTVFLSSHMLSEVEKVADDLVILGKGQILVACSLAEFAENAPKDADGLEDAYLALVESSVEFLAEID